LAGINQCAKFYGMKSNASPTAAGNNISSRICDLFPLACLFLVVFLLWLPTYHFGFGQEEFRYFHDYSGREILKGFYSHWEPSLTESVGYRPGHALHIWLVYRLLGGSAEASHLVQLFLLLAFSWLFFRFLLEVSASASIAFWGVCIYLCLGNTAWHVAQVVNRQHLILLVSWAGMMLLYLRYLECGKARCLTGSCLFFLGGLLVKETALTYPFQLAALALLVGKRNLWETLRRLWPFFLTLSLFLVVRYFATREAAAVSQTPPPAPFSLSWMAREYGRSLAGALVPVQGTRGYEVIPKETELSFNWPAYFRVGLAFLVLLAIPGLWLSLKNGQGRILAFGFTVYLLASVLVAAWYRTNRLFIADLGLTVILGTCAAESFSFLRGKLRRTEKFLAGAAAMGLLGYLAANLVSHQATLKVLYPYGEWIVDHCREELTYNHEYIPEEMEKLMIEKSRLYGDLPAIWRAREERSRREKIPPDYPY